MNLARALVIGLLGCCAHCTVYLGGSGPDDSGSGSTDSSTPGFPVSHQCTFACSTSNDCSNATGRPADDFSCLGGACQDLGCQSDGECIASMGSTYVCRSFNGGLPTCTIGCGQQLYCVTAYSGTFESDELACVSGGCLYTGCTSTSECSHIGVGLGCFQFGSATPVCAATCQTVNDCVTASGGAHTADQFNCNQGGCQFLGCLSNNECPSGPYGGVPVCH